MCNPRLAVRGQRVAGKLLLQCLSPSYCIYTYDLTPSFVNDVLLGG